MAPSRASIRDPGRALLIALAGILIGPTALRADEPLRDLAGIDEGGAWHAIGSDGVLAKVEPLNAGGRGALRLSFDFHGGAGFAVAERTRPLDLPENFEIEITLRGQSLDNDLEFKLIDASGDNVWWYRKANFGFPSEWRTVRIKRHQIEFAWGPAKDHSLRHVERLQLVVNAGRGGGSGMIEVSSMTLRPLPPPPTAWPAPVTRRRQQGGAGSTQLPAEEVAGTAWHCRREPSRACDFDVDYGVLREFGGLRLDWEPGRYASVYDVFLSDDGRGWRKVRQVAYGVGGVDQLWLPDSEARYVRLRLEQGPAPEFGLARLTLLDVAVGASRNSLIQMAAPLQPRGSYPRGFSEQSYWTLVGVDGGAESGLLSEDGAVEVGRGGISVEPFVVEEHRVSTWADVEIRHSLADGYLPMPSVEWQSAHWTLAITAFAADAPGGTGLWAHYRLLNRTARPLRLRFVLAARPFEVNPPAQFLTTPGGVSPISSLDWDGRELLVNGGTRIVPLVRPQLAGVFAYDQKAVPGGFDAEAWPEPGTIVDDSGLETGALGYDVELAPDAATDFGVLVPWPIGRTVRGARVDLAALRAAEQAAAASWRTRLNGVAIVAPDAPEAGEVANALRTTLAHILISRNGPMLRPGTRSYARSWIRDGAMMSEALLELGELEAPKQYLRWYSGFLFANGKVPCCVDERGADPVPENDSAGEFIYLAAEVWRRTHDRPLLTYVWPKVRAAAAYLESLRQSARTEADRHGPNPEFYGLVPASISHEGYSAKPMHSYWDDFWALRGYTDAVFLAKEFGETGEAAALARSGTEFATDLAASLRLVTSARALQYLPGAAELGDFDATSTTIVLAPGSGPIALPDGLLAATFERYWREFVARRDGSRAWTDYTPYEWRTVGSFVRLGSITRAHAALTWFMADRRPREWNQWPEVIGREPRVPRFIGDLPHGWVGSDFIRSALDLFAWERGDDGAIVIAAGLPPEWLDGRGITIRDLPTRFGRLGYTLRRAGRTTELRLDAGSAVPPGGFVLQEPEHGATARIDGRVAQWRNGELRISEVPASVVLYDAGSTTRRVSP